MMIKSSAQGPRKYLQKSYSSLNGTGVKNRHGFGFNCLDTDCRIVDNLLAQPLPERALRADHTASTSAERRNRRETADH